MNLITDLKQVFSKEEFEAQVAAFKEVPMNQILVVLKPKGMYSDTPSDLVNPVERREAEQKTYGQMKVVAVSPDLTVDIAVGDLVRVQMFKVSPGTPMECTIPKYELVLVKQYDILTVEKV